MIELSIPQAGEETKTTKDLVFTLLSKQQPQSAIQLHNKIKKNYNVSLTYQAVSKALRDLVDKRVLKKESKNYSINTKWLIEVKTTIDKLLTRNESDQQLQKFDEEFANTQYAVYTLTNLYELDAFWDDMLIHLADTITPDEHQSFLAHAHYGWWLLINLGKETKMFSHLLDKGLSCYNLFIGKHPLNLWAKDIYSELGVTFTVIEDETIDESITLNVVGDTVIQVHYPQHILDRLEEFYTTYSTTQEMSMKEISELAHEQSELKFIIFKNREIAQSLRDKYMQYFE